MLASSVILSYPLKMQYFKFWEYFLCTCKITTHKYAILLNREIYSVSSAHGKFMGNNHLNYSLRAFVFPLFKTSIFLVSFKSLRLFQSLITRICLPSKNLHRRQVKYFSVENNTYLQAMRTSLLRQQLFLYNHRK